MQTKHKWLLANFLIISVGILLRSRNYLGCRSLWLDEVFSVLSLQQYGFFELFKPAEIPQWSPLGFLASTRILITLFGDSEYVYRLVPFIVGCASLFLFYHFARAFLQPITTLYCNALFSLSASLKFYSNEFKPYIVDVATGLLLAIVLIPFIERKLLRREALLIGSLGGIFVWFSYPITFVMAGIGTLVTVRFLLLKDFLSFRNAMIMIGLWLVSFSVNYTIFLKDIPEISAIENYWSDDDYYMPFFPTTYSELIWYKNNAVSYFEQIAGVRKMGVFLLGLFCLGGISLCFAKKYYLLFYLTLPIAVVLLVSALKLYPFTGRLVLFTVPFAFIVVGAGFDWLQRILRPRAYYSVVLLMVISLVPAGFTAAREGIQGSKVSEVRDVLVRASPHMKPADAFICFPHFEPFHYYADKFGIDIRAPRNLDIDDLPGTMAELESADHVSSIWIGFTFIHEGTREEILEEFRKHFREVNYFEDVRASLHQFKKRR